jgi:hypothetical protein
MTIIRVARPKDAEALLTLAKAFATSFVVDPNAFRVAFVELLALPSGYLAVGLTFPDNSSNPDRRKFQLPKAPVW